MRRCRISIISGYKAWAVKAQKKEFSTKYISTDPNRIKVSEINYNFLFNRNFWLHAKNGDAFNILLQDCTLNVFWHTTEDWVLTSKHYIWTYPNKTLYPESICVLPEQGWVGDIKKCYGVCTDYVIEFLKH